MTAREVRRAVGWIGGGVFASSAIQYALFFALARLLGTGDYGAFALALSLAVLSAPFCDLGTNVSMLCSGSRRPRQIRQQLGAALLLRLLLCAPVGVAAFALGGLLGYGARFAALFAPLFLAAVTDGVGNLCSSACQAEGRPRAAAVLMVCRNLARCAALAAAMALGAELLALAWLYAAGSIAGAALAVAVTARGRRIPMRAGLLVPLVREALPFGTAVIAALIQGQIGAAMLGALADESEVGRFHAAMRFVVLLQMVPQVIVSASAPLAYRRGAQGVEASVGLYRVKTAALALFGLPAALALATLAEPLVRLCLGEGFAASAPVLAALAPVAFTASLSAALGSTLSAVSRQGILSLGNWLALGANAAAGLCLIPPLGALGAAISLAFAEVLLLSFLSWQVARSGIDLAWRELLGHCAMAAAAALVLSLFWPVLAMPGAAATALALAWARPTDEERRLWRAVPSR
ncbi:MAG: flippase [Planctomycetota bacterium]